MKNENYGNLNVTIDKISKLVHFDEILETVNVYLASSASQEEKKGVCEMLENLTIVKGITVSWEHLYWVTRGREEWSQSSGDRRDYMRGDDEPGMGEYSRIYSLD